MGVKTIGISLQPALVERLDALAARAGLSRSAYLARLVEEEGARQKARGKDSLEVVIDGVVYRPARARPVSKRPRGAKS